MPSTSLLHQGQQTRIFLDWPSHLSINNSDPLSGDAATTTQDGLQDSSDGMKIIPGASLTGQTAPVGQAGQDVLDECGGVPAAAADVASKNTTSTNDLGTSGSDIGSRDSDSSSTAKSWAILMQGACTKFLTSLARQRFRKSSCPCWTP